MSYLLRTVTITRRPALVLVLAALALVSSACGGGSAKLDTPRAGAPTLGSTQTGAGASGRLVQPPALPALPSPAQISRGASLIETGAVAAGSSFRDDLTHQNVSVVGDNALYDPVSSSGVNPLFEDVALAIYSFDVSPDTADFSGGYALGLDCSTESAGAAVHVYAGVPSLAGESWEWQEFAPDSAAHGASSVSLNFTKIEFDYKPQRARGGVVSVVIAIIGDAGVNVERLTLLPRLAVGTVPVAMTEAFRKGWDGTIKGRTEFDGSVHVSGDGAGQLFCSYYDSSVGQLYFMRLQDRLWTTQAVDCSGDTGLFNDLVYDPTVGLQLPYYDFLSKKGYDYYMAKSDMASLVWSPRSNFDSGDDGSGLPPADVGSRCSAVIDPATGQTHIFYEDATSQRIRHAWGLGGSVPWQSEFVSAPGEDASCPVAMLCAAGVCCAFVVNSHSGPFDLVLAQPGGPTGWLADTLATDVANPLGAASTLAGFCDGSVRPGTDEVAIAYSSTGGVRVIHREVAARNTLRSDVVDDSPGAGAFVKLAMLDDGSVCVFDYRGIQSRQLVFIRESPTLAGTYSTLPAIQLPEGTDCDDLDFWVNPTADANGFHDAALVVLTSKLIPGTTTAKKEFKGHVTLLK